MYFILIPRQTENVKHYLRILQYLFKVFYHLPNMRTLRWTCASLRYLKLSLQIYFSFLFVIITYKFLSLSKVSFLHLLFPSVSLKAVRDIEENQLNHNVIGYSGRRSVRTGRWNIDLFQFPLGFKQLITQSLFLVI
ncbi:MAG: hypothetical protein CM15mP117_23360 [Alphaproteobacteria bacterium]|nr:MAG: hypothetical protein CM15mP117_23360 [Alphaproteobacteria bacterium]